MLRDYTIYLWLLKLGGLINLYFLAKTLPLPSDDAHAYIILPAQIFFAVSAYRCLFPVWYKHNVVFHDSVFSSIFATRLFATFSEIATSFCFLMSFACSISITWNGCRPFLADANRGRDQPGFRLGCHTDRTAQALLLRGTGLGSHLRGQHDCQRIPVPDRRRTRG